MTRLTDRTTKSRALNVQDLLQATIVDQNYISHFHLELFPNINIFNKFLIEEEEVVSLLVHKSEWQCEVLPLHSHNLIALCVMSRLPSKITSNQPEYSTVPASEVLIGWRTESFQWIWGVAKRGKQGRIPQLQVRISQFESLLNGI